MASVNDTLVNFLLSSGDLLPRIDSKSTQLECEMFRKAVKVWARYEFDREIILDDRGYNSFEIINIVEALADLNVHEPVFDIKKSPEEYAEAVKYIMDTYAVESPSDMIFSTIQSFIIQNVIDYIHVCEPKTVHKLTSTYIKWVTLSVLCFGEPLQKYEAPLKKLNINRDLALVTLCSCDPSNANIQVLMSYLSS